MITTRVKLDKISSSTRNAALAAEVAALLHRYFELPEQEAVRALELAEAASARSCAYLSCFNLKMESREAEGKPTQKRRVALRRRRLKRLKRRDDRRK